MKHNSCLCQKWQVCNRCVCADLFKSRDACLELKAAWLGSHWHLNNEESSPQEQHTQLITRIDPHGFTFSNHANSEVFFFSVRLIFRGVYGVFMVPRLPTVFSRPEQKSAWTTPGATMEAWPTVAWVLLLTSIADWLKTAQSRDFTMMDIIMLHPSSRSVMLDSSPGCCSRHERCRKVSERRSAAIFN